MKGMFLMSNKVRILLNSVQKVKNFVLIAEVFESDIEVISGKWIVDGSSIMGLFSLNLLEPLLVRIDSDNQEEIESFYRVMEEFKWEE